MYLWQTGGKQIGILALIMVLGLVVVKYWQHHKQVEDQLVAKNYQIMLSAMSKDDLVTVKNQGIELMKINSHTPYPRFAALFLTKLAEVDNDLETAANHLRWITKQAHKDPIWHIANLRLIKILLLQNKLSEVEEIKNSIENKIPESFYSKYQELYGDLLVAKNQKTAANLLYRDAVKHLPQQIPTTLLDLKITETDMENN